MPEKSPKTCKLRGRHLIELQQKAKELGQLTLQARQEAQAFQYGAVFEDDLEHNPAIDLLENHLDELADALINEE